MVLRQERACPVSLCRPGVAIVASAVVRLGMEEGARIRVRWLDIMPTRHNGIEMFLVRDPEGITDQSLIVSREALFLISLMDGTKSASDLQQALMKASGRLSRRMPSPRWSTPSTPSSFSTITGTATG